MPNSRIQRVASLRRTVAVCTLVVFMALWGAVLEFGPGGGSSSSASTAGTSSTTSGATSSQSSSSGDTASQASTPLTTSQS